VKVFDAEYVKPFSSNTGTSRTDWGTDIIAISISRVSVLRREKNFQKTSGDKKFLTHTVYI